MPVPLGAELATSGAAIPDDDLFIVVVVELAREDVIVVGRGVLVTVDRPLTTTPGPIEDSGVESVEDVRGVLVVPMELDIVDEPINPGLIVVVGRPEAEIEVPGIIDVTVAASDVVVPHPDVLVAQAPPGPGGMATVHVSTSFTAGFPFSPVMGVRIITHVLTIGPASV